MTSPTRVRVASNECCRATPATGAHPVVLVVSTLNCRSSAEILFCSDDQRLVISQSPLKSKKSATPRRKKAKIDDSSSDEDDVRAASPEAKGSPANASRRHFALDSDSSDDEGASEKENRPSANGISTYLSANTCMNDLHILLYKAHLISL